MHAGSVYAHGKLILLGLPSSISTRVHVVLHRQHSVLEYGTLVAETYTVVYHRNHVVHVLGVLLSAHRIPLLSTGTYGSMVPAVTWQPEEPSRAVAPRALF